MLKKFFYKWVEYHIRKITHRQLWVTATIFRYRQLLKKSFKAIQQYKKNDYEMTLKRKVFNSFKLVIEENARMIEEIQNIQLRRYFQKFKFMAQDKQRNREVTDAIVDCYNNKLLMKWFIKLKKAVKIIRKRKNIEKQIENKRKQLFFDKWSLKLQDIKLYQQLLQDSQKYYNEVLIKKSFKGWKQMLKNKKIYEKQLVVLSNFFKNWRKYSKEQNAKRNQKYKPIHIKWRKLVFFAYWKNATLDSQKEKLAKDFYLNKIFQSWRMYIDNVQQIQLKLQDKELALTLKQMKRIKLRCLHYWINRYNFTIDKKGLNKILLETKLKQKRLQQLQFGFKSLKNNVQLNQFQRNKQLVLKQKILYSFKYFTDIRKVKLNRLAQFQETKKLKNQKCIFDALKQPFLALKIKENKARMYYNQRLIKDYFHLFISGIIKQYQKQLKLSAQFYYQRRLIYIFSALKQHSLEQIKRRINKKRLEKYLGQKQYKQMKLIFFKLRGILFSELKGKKKLLQLEYNVFYQWRLITRLSVIKRK